VHSPRCGSGNRPIDKRACLFLLEQLFQAELTDAQEESGVQCPIVPASPRREDQAVRQEYRLGLAALPQRFVVFDLETQRSAEEVGGWQWASRMGVAVAVVYDSQLGDFLTYLEDEVDQLIDHLAGSELVVGFNNRRFDNQVLSPYSSIDLNRLPTLDLLEEVHAYLGYRLSLNGLAEQTLGVKKTADGLQSLRWYKEGRIDLIRHYCRKDVEITRDLLFHALEHGFLLFANKKKEKVQLPLRLDLRIGALLTKATGAQ
jgi:DEAD/DEAH box helicase domain-containing protein